MNSISDTAFLTCGARAADAASRKPVCGDAYAARFLNEHGKRVFDVVKKDLRFCSSIVARHRIIDDLLRAKLVENARTSVVIIGAGFDSRAYRMDGGHWTEIDEPQVINFKNKSLAADQCRNSLRRVSIDFGEERLSEKLPAVAAGDPVVVVMEGVFLYLSEAQIGETIRTLQHAFPRHTLICDLHTRFFMERFGKKLARQIEAMGATFKFFPDDPRLIFQQAGYRVASVVSIIVRLLELANNKVGLFFVTRFMRRLVQGYAIYVFEASDSTAR